MRSYYKAGTWNCICEVCGSQVKSDEIIKRWDGRLVCRADFEPRHSLDFIRAIPDNNTVPFVAPEGEDVYVFVCYLEYSQGIADLGQADCARADYVLPANILASLL